MQPAGAAQLRRAAGGGMQSVATTTARAKGPHRDKERHTGHIYTWKIFYSTDEDIKLELVQECLSDGGVTKQLQRLKKLVRTLQSPPLAQSPH